MSTAGCVLPPTAQPTMLTIDRSASCRTSGGISSKRWVTSHSASARVAIAKYSIRMPLSADIAHWAAQVSFDDLPPDVVAATKLRVLDVVGLALAGAGTPFG